ncbi:hypothetical protein DUI87_02417 [Hirundo rustica rustica]|uniref:ribonuclease H n=1 Tax=Hirundo rustica rustica TaxID=333673 RepID=A0A3M0L8W4_HIRRU|nr:hypothetical protein DUI87_02417 [Hirundo rustica rustica]
MKVKIMKLTAGDIEEINPEVWAEGGKSGLLNIPPIEVKMQPGTPPIRIKQYPMSLEGKKGLIPIIEQLLKEGILEPCMSPHNTPILAVKKAEGKYRLVQDLREINKRTITKHPVVPNPYNLLSQIPQEHAWFTTIDLKDAFWACPLAEESRDWFAFEWDHPETKRRQQLRWTRLPQGFTESPNLFGQALERLLEQFTPEGQVQILQYVDDLLISGENQLEVRTTSIKLLNFLGEKGLKVSKRKLQFVKPEVTYLGHLIGKGYKKLSPERIAGIIAIPAPKTKRDIRKLLGLFGYCRHWIDEYTQNVRFLYDKLVSPEPIEWTQEDEKQLEKLKNKLSTAPVLSLPDLKKEFDLFVNTEGGVAYGVLAQEWGGCKKPIAFLSKILDPVARGWPACLQAVAATAVLVEESQKLTLNGKIQIHTPHDIKTVLSQKAPGWVTDSRILKYEITLINSENLRLTVSKNLNPAQFLSGEPPPDLEHDCLELMSLQTKVREDLESTPLPYGKRLFTDGSSRVLEGKRVSGYAVVEGSTIEDIQVRETGKLPSSWSAQLCEIYAVKRGLDLLGGDRGTIYTDSKYAFGIVHTFGKIWEERGYLNSKGKDLVHKEMIRSVLTSLLKPIEIAVVHVKGHQKETTFEGKGNQLADKEAKRAAQDPKGSIRILALNETSEEEGGEEKPNEIFKGMMKATFNSNEMVPSDIKDLFRCLLTPSEYDLWEGLWKKALKTVLQEIQQTPDAQDSDYNDITHDHLCGEGDLASANEQIRLLSKSVLDKICNAAEKTFYQIPSPEIKSSYVYIKQFSSENFLQFVDHLRSQVERQVQDPVVQAELIKEMAQRNANETCRRIILSLPLDPSPSLAQMIEACTRTAELFSAPERNPGLTHPKPVAAAAPGARRQPMSSDRLQHIICHCCKRPGHFAKACPENQKCKSKNQKN